MLPVNEIFETLQGEASWTGTPSVFVRLQGCAVGCPWCDTKHTWPVDRAEQISIDAMLAKVDAAKTYASMTVEDLMRVLDLMDSRHIVLTGGEPCDYDLTELTHKLVASRRTVQIETSGTSPIRCAPGTWVTLSPKIDMPGGRHVLDDACARANEVKMPVGRIDDIEKFDEVLRLIRPDVSVWLQPLSQSEKATELCISIARKCNWRVSLQTHKFAGLR